MAVEAENTVDKHQQQTDGKSADVLQAAVHAVQEQQKRTAAIQATARETTVAYAASPKPAPKAAGTRHQTIKSTIEGATLQLKPTSALPDMHNSVSVEPPSLPAIAGPEDTRPSLSSLELPAVFDKDAQLLSQPIAEQDITDPRPVTLDAFIDTLRSISTPHDDVELGDTETTLVALEVAEHLAALEPASQEIAALAVYEITNTALEIQSLQLTAQDPQELLIQQQKLITLVSRFFDTIHLEYDQAKVLNFVHMLTDQQFAERLALVSTPWREGISTHEVRRREPTITTQPDEMSLRYYILGFVAIIRTNPKIQLYFV